MGKEISVHDLSFSLEKEVREGDPQRQDKWACSFGKGRWSTKT